MDVRLPIYKVNDSGRLVHLTDILLSEGANKTITLPSELSTGNYEVVAEFYADTSATITISGGGKSVSLTQSGSHKQVVSDFSPTSSFSSITLSLNDIGHAEGVAFVTYITIRRKDGERERYVAEKWEFHDEMMGARNITFQATSHTPIDWHIGDYLIYRGQTFYLNNVPTVTQNARPNEAGDAFVYENVRFDDDQGKMYDCMVLDVTPTTGDYVASRGTNYTGSSVFSIYCAETTVEMKDTEGNWHNVTLSPVAYLAGLAQANLNRLYPNDGWRVDVNPNLAGLDDKSVSVNQWYVPQLLAEIHNLWEVDYICIGRTIKIGYTLNNITGNDSTSYMFGYGEGYARFGDDGKSLLKIKRTANSSQRIITRLRAMGSTRNMPYRYYNNVYELPQAMFVQNLQLPDTFLSFAGTTAKKRYDDPANKTAGNANRDTVYGRDADNMPILRHVLGESNDAYIDKHDDAASCPEGIREGAAFWDGSNSDLEEIYPTIKGGTYKDLRAADIPDMDGRSPSLQPQPTDAYPNYDNNERIDALLGTDNKTNIGDGVMSEADARNQFQVVKTVRVAQKTLTWSSSGQSDFTQVEGGTSITKEAKRDTLFTISNVAKGSYHTEPVTQNVKLFVKYAPSGDSSAKVRFRFTINATDVTEGTTTAVSEYTSAAKLLTSAGNFVPFELPSIPNVDPSTQESGGTTLEIGAVSDISVIFALEIVDSASVANGSFIYYIDSNDQDVVPEYIWQPQGAADTIINTPFSIYIKDIGIDLSNITTTGEDATIHFNTGACGGMDFKWNPNTATPITVGNKKGWKIEITERFTDDTIHAYYPNENSPLSAGDQFVLLNIEFPEAYIKIAELRLLDAATKYLSYNCEQKYIYEPEISDIYIKRNMDFCEAAGMPETSIYWNLYAGYKFSMRGIPDAEDQILPVIDNVTIKTVTIREGEQDIPHVEIVLNNDVEQSTLQKLSVTVDRIYSGIFGQGGGGGSVNYATLMSLLNSEGRKMFISKIYNDTAKGKITFKSGLTAGQFLQDVSGVGVYKEGDSWHIEADFLHARKKLIAKELQIEEISHIGGKVLLTAAEMVCDHVEEYDDFYRCYFLTKDNDGKEIFNKFKAGDQAIMQSFNVSDWGVAEDINRNRYFWRLVVGVGGGATGEEDELPEVTDYHYIDLSKSDCDSGSDSPMAGDKIIQLGYRYNNEPDRQNAIAIAGAGSGSPYIDEYEGINSYTLEGKCKTRIKPGDSFFSGVVHINPSSTYNGSSLGDYLVDYSDDILNIINQLQGLDSQFQGFAGDLSSLLSGFESLENGFTGIQGELEGLQNLTTGNENLLRNTGFTGDFETMDTDTDERFDGEEQVYSDQLKYWSNSNAKVVANINSASGFAVQLTNGNIGQNATKPLLDDEWYNVSFRASGSSLTFSVGGHTETVSLGSTIKRYYFKFKCTNSTSNGFSIHQANATVMEIQLCEGSVPNVDWIPSPLDNSSAIAYYQNLVYIANAIANGSTSILGGLVLTQMIRVGNYRNKQMVQETGGMSGIYTSNNSPFLWGGGTMEDAFFTIAKYARDPSYQATPEEVAKMAKFVVTHGGRAILNDIILRGYIYAEGGVFKNITSPNHAFNIDSSGTLECTNARLKGNLYTPMFVVNASNMARCVAIDATDPENIVALIHLSVTGLNVHFTQSPVETAAIQLPTHSSYNGAQAYIMNSSGARLVIHGAYGIYNNFDLESGHVGIFYCYDAGNDHYYWTQINR